MPSRYHSAHMYQVNVCIWSTVLLFQILIVWNKGGETPPRRCLRPVGEKQPTEYVVTPCLSILSVCVCFFLFLGLLNDLIEATTCSSTMRRFFLGTGIGDCFGTISCDLLFRGSSSSIGTLVRKHTFKISSYIRGLEMFKKKLRNHVSIALAPADYS